MDINISELVKNVAQKIQKETGTTASAAGLSEQKVDQIIAKLVKQETKTPSEKLADELTAKVLQDMKGGASQSTAKLFGNYQYPLAKNHPEALKSKSGKAFSDITFEKVIQGQVTHEDFKTDANTLLMQAEIAEKAGKKQFAGNLRRAAELTRVPDDEVLKIYDKLRPNRATKAELLEIAQTLRTQYDANMTADLIEETAKVYEKRNILL